MCGKVNFLPRVNIKPGKDFRFCTEYESPRCGLGKFDAISNSPSAKVQKGLSSKNDVGIRTGECQLKLAGNAMAITISIGNAIDILTSPKIA